MLSSGGAAGDSASLRVPVERGSEPGTGLVSDTSSNLAMALVARLMRGHPTRLAGGGWTGAGRSAGALRDLLLPGGLGAPAREHLRAVHHLHAWPPLARAGGDLGGVEAPPLGARERVGAGGGQRGQHRLGAGLAGLRQAPGLGVLEQRRDRL